MGSGWAQPLEGCSWAGVPVCVSLNPHTQTGGPVHRALHPPHPPQVSCCLPAQLFPYLWVWVCAREGTVLFGPSVTHPRSSQGSNLSSASSETPRTRERNGRFPYGV